MPATIDSLERLLVALLVGLLIGLDVIACASNNVFKAGVAIVRGAGRFRRDLAGAMTLVGTGAPP
jgi:hypothetical protein